MSDDGPDADLFRAAVRDAVPLRAEVRHRIEARKAPAVPVQSLLDEHEALRETLLPGLDDEPPEAGENESYLAACIGRDVLRKLRRGAWRVQRELDLHGMTKAEAHAQLTAFLHECTRQGWRCVRIVHGKGLGSKNREPVLKSRVRAWLARRIDVLAYCETPPAQGGSGALLVLLKT